MASNKKTKRNRKIVMTGADLAAITTDWEKTCARKATLIRHKIDGIACRSDLAELEKLKRLTEARGELFSPLPIKALQTMRRKLIRKGQFVGK